MTKTKQRILNKNFVISIILFLLTTIIFYFAPYTHDDWAWGSSLGLERLHSLFDNYNGRWAGNIAVLILTRIRLLKAIFCALTLLIIVVLSRYFINKKNIQLSYLMAFLLMLMPLSVLSQGIFWTSGFTNYVIPIALILIFIVLNKDLFDKGSSSISNKFIIPFLILGFVTSLFIENLTIYNIFLSIFIIVYQVIKNKNVNFANISYFIGSILGTILMFSNSAYSSIFNSSDAYRSIEQGNIIVRAFNTYFDSFYNYLFNNNFIINIIIGILVALISYMYIKKNNLSKTKLFLSSIPVVFVLLYISYLIFSKIIYPQNILVTDNIRNTIEAILPILFFIGLFISSMLMIKDDNKKKRLAFILISIIMFNAPLFIVTPIGPRCFVGNYILFCLVAIELFDYLSSEYKLNLSYIFAILCLIFFSFYLLIFGYIFKIEMIRDNEIKNNLNTSVLVVPELPYKEYMQNSTPPTPLFENRFKKFYHIDKNVDIEFVTYSKFKDK